MAVAVIRLTAKMSLTTGGSACRWTSTSPKSACLRLLPGRSARCPTAIAVRVAYRALMAALGVWKVRAIVGDKDAWDHDHREVAKAFDGEAQFADPVRGRAPQGTKMISVPRKERPSPC
jgi:hypothetical protein